MGAVRRSHAGALLALGLLVLLLLARLPPTPVPHRPRPALLTSSSSSSSSLPTNRTQPPPAPVPAHPAAPAKSEGGPRPVLLRDLYEAGFSTPAAELCPGGGAALRLLILVTSAPSHSSARDAVRLTWGHYAARADVTLGFVLGAPPPSLRPALDAESALYGDLIVGRSIDSYSNLTLKTISMLEWTRTYCPLAPHLLKTDDDMFVNVPRLLRFASERVNATRTIWGRVVKRSLPKRTTRSKYYVPEAQFPGRVFPDFATGPAYLLTADCIGPLLEAAPGERYLRLEDVFVTGVLSAKLGISRRHAAEFYNRKVSGHPCALQRGVAVHMVRWHEQFDFWRKLLDNRTKCAPAAPPAPKRLAKPPVAAPKAPAPAKKS